MFTSCRDFASDLAVCQDAWIYLSTGLRVQGGFPQLVNLSLHDQPMHGEAALACFEKCLCDATESHAAP